MGMMPAYRAVLKEEMTGKECESTLSRIQQMKGVLGASFVVAADNSSEIWITHNDSNKELPQAVRKIPGIKDVKPLI